MDWCKLAAGYYRDAALLRAGEAAEVLFLRGLAYCAEHDTGGLIVDNMLPYLCPTRSASRASRLVSEGLWTRVGGGFVVRSWHVWQESGDVLVERRKRDAERKRADRAVKPDTPVHGMSADMSTDASADSRESKSKKRDKEQVQLPAGDSAPASITQRSKIITDRYTLAEPMSRWPAVNGVVIRALKTERWTDAEVSDALLRLAADRRSVTVEVLRVELDGLPPHPVRQSPGTAAVRATMAWALADEPPIDQRGLS